MVYVPFMHPSTWKGRAANFALRGFSEVRCSRFGRCLTPRWRTRLRSGGAVQDPADGVYHHLRLVPLDEMPAALYDTVDAAGREASQLALEILPYLVQPRPGFGPRGRFL